MTLHIKAHGSEHNPILDQARKEQAAITPATGVPELADIPAPTEQAEEADPKLQAVQEALAANTSQISASITELTRNARQTQAATDVITSSLADITSASLITAAAVGAADLQAQNSTIAAFEAGGGTNSQIMLMKQLTKDNARVNDILDKRQILAEEDRFGPGIGLIDTAINQFNINLTNQELAAAEAQQVATTRQIANVTGATESFARVNQLTKKSINEATIEANYARIEAEGAIKRAEAEIRGIHSNSVAMNSILTADTKRVSGLLQSYRLEKEEQEIALRQERTSFQRKEMAHKVEQWQATKERAAVELESAQLRLTAAKDAAPAQKVLLEQRVATATKAIEDRAVLEESLVSSVQSAQSLSGVPIEDAVTILWGLDQRGEIGKKYATLHQLGGAADPVLGLTPFEAKSNLNLVSPTSNFITTKGTKLLDSITMLQLEAYKKVAAPPTQLDVIASDFNKQASTFLGVAATDIKQGDGSNPYQAPPMSVLAEMKDVASSTFYQKVLKPKNMVEVVPQTVVDAAVNAIIAKTVTPEEAAAGIEAIFDAAALHNNTIQGGFKRVGLGAHSQTTYNTRLKLPASFLDRAADMVSISSLLTPIGIIATAKSVISGDASLAKKVITTNTETVDLMNRAAIQQHIVRLSLDVKFKTDKLNK